MLGHKASFHMGLLYNISVFLESFSFKQEERFDCGTKAGDVFASQRRFPQQMFWDFKVVFQYLSLGGKNAFHLHHYCVIDLLVFSPQLNLIGEKDDIPAHFCDKCGLPIRIYGRMVCLFDHVLHSVLCVS